jgi:hypothetical protein
MHESYKKNINLKLIHKNSKLQLYKSSTSHPYDIYVSIYAHKSYNSSTTSHPYNMQIIFLLISYIL